MWLYTGLILGDILGRSDFLGKLGRRETTQCVCINMHGYTSFNYNINTINITYDISPVY
jgi:hypothetical protein